MNSGESAPFFSAIAIASAPRFSMRLFRYFISASELSKPSIFVQTSSVKIFKSYHWLSGVMPACTLGA